MNKKDSRFLYTTYFLFGIVIVFLTVNLVHFMSVAKVSYSMTEKGQIIEVDHYKGWIIRDEQIVTSFEQGLLTRKCEEGAYVKKNTLVCVLNRSLDMTQISESKIEGINQSIASRVVYKSDQFSPLMADLKNYVVNTTDQKFADIYTLEEKYKQTLQLILSSQVEDIAKKIQELEADKERNQQLIDKNQTVFTTSESGIVSYYMDGYENYSITDFEGLIKDKKIISENKDEKQLYKIIDNNFWYLVIEADAKMIERAYADETYPTLKINYSKHDLNMTGEVINRVNIDNKEYIVLRFNKYLDYIIRDRTMEFSIKYVDYTGIKIPNTAIKSKAFFEIPSNFVETSNNGIKVRKQVSPTAGQTSTDGIQAMDISPSMYYKEEEFYYIPTDDQLSEMDTLLSIDTTDQKMVVQKKAFLSGVIIRNKGFDAFKLISILYQGDEYAIVEDSLPFGVRLYDRILVDIKNQEVTTAIKESEGEE